MGIFALFPCGSKHFWGYRDTFMLIGKATSDLLASVFEQLLYWSLLVEEAIDKRAVGAIFQQTSHQIGKQISVVADGGVDAHRDGSASGLS